MITLKELAEDNIEECLKLNAGGGKESFVANSFAIAWLLRETARPLLICAENRVVGFILLVLNAKRRECYISRMMTDVIHRRKGYAKAALREVIGYACNAGCKSICLSFAAENEAARRLYTSVGFLESGAAENSEVVMEMELE